jgi:hypothetical protein
VVYMFFVDPYIQNVLSLKPFVPILNRFHRWIPRIEILKLDLMLLGFDAFFCHEKTGLKNHTGSTFFSLSERHGRASRESQKNAFFVTVMPLVEANPCLSPKQNYAYHGMIKRKKTCVFSFPRGTAVPLTEAKNVFFSRNFFRIVFVEKLRKTGGKPKSRKPPEKNHLKSRKRMRKN